MKVNQNTNTGGGKSVTVEYDRNDGGKVQVTYMHLSDISVKVGDGVNAGQAIGVSGNTGTRTTGPHLHFEVKTVGSDGTARNIDPAAYLAEIAQRGNISQTVMYNGQNLLAKYKTEEPSNPAIANNNDIDTSLSPEAWMKKILSSEDSGVGMSGSDPVVEMAMTLFTSLMALAVQIDGKSQESQMQAATDAALNKRVDLTPLLPNLKECNLLLSDGRTLLQVNNGTVNFTHELTNAESARLQQALGNSNLSNEDKQRAVATVINGIIVSRQMSQNYQQGIDAQENQSEIVQRK